MLTHRGFSAWIVSDGVSLPEHLVAVDAQKHRVQCWIPSEPGKTFEVYWRDHGGGVDTCSFVTLDGLVVPGQFLFGTGEASRKGVRSGLVAERPFTFLKVEDAGTLQRPNKDAGIITLRIKRIVRTGKYRPTDQLREIPDNQGKNIQGELRVGYGQETETSHRYSSTFDFTQLDGGHSYVTFVFRYRTRDFLLTQGIMSDVPEMLKVKKRAPTRRVVSEPVAPMAPYMSMMPSPTPSPSGQTKNLPEKFHPYKALGHQRGVPYSQTPRSASSRSVRPTRFPGEGLLKFDKRTEGNNTGGGNSGGGPVNV